MINRLFLGQFISGEGIEIGAYHNPFPFSATRAKVKYVDKHSYETLIKMRDKDSSLAHKPELARVDIIDDGQFLRTIADNSQDFVLSSHQLEHCESPITAIENHMRVLRPGGKIIYAVPDKRFTFDKNREITSWFHIKSDHFKTLDGTYDQEHLIAHYDEYLLNVDKIEDANVRREIALSRIKTNEEVHFHCWDDRALLLMFHKMHDYLRFEIELFARAGHENWVILRKI